MNEDTPAEQPDGEAELISVRTAVGLEGLTDLANMGMGEMYAPLSYALRKAIATAYALGYHEAMEGKPSAVPSIVQLVQAEED